MLRKIKPPKLDEWAIKAELYRRGFTFNHMAAESGLSAKYFSAALKKPLPKANQFIAQKLGIPLHELWPFWFDADGDLIPAKYRRKLSSQRENLASPHFSRRADAA